MVLAKGIPVGRPDARKTTRQRSRVPTIAATVQFGQMGEAWRHGWGGRLDGGLDRPNGVTTRRDLGRIHPAR
jgi:hypothetical protein